MADPLRDSQPDKFSPRFEIEEGQPVGKALRGNPSSRMNGGWKRVNLAATVAFVQQHAVFAPGCHRPQTDLFLLWSDPSCCQPLAAKVEIEVGPGGKGKRRRGNEAAG